MTCSYPAMPGPSPGAAPVYGTRVPSCRTSMWLPFSQVRKVGQAKRAASAVSRV